MFRSASISAGSRWLSILTAAVTGVLAVAISAEIGTMRHKSIAMVIAAILFSVFLLIWRRPKEIFLFLFLFFLTYNRAYFVFTPIVGYHGFEGPYLIVADVFFVGLLTIWLFELVVLKVPLQKRAPAFWPWYLPFVIAAALSMFVAARPDWSAFEFMRVLKVAGLLLYCQYNLGKREWVVAAGAIIAALLAQSTLGILQVITGSNGVLAVLGIGTDASVVNQAFSQMNFYGWHRATATMNHPPNLACYMLLTMPILLVLGMTLPRTWWRRASLFGLLVALGGLACTLSRMPWAIAVLQMLFILFALVVMRQFPMQRVFRWLIIAVLGLAAALIPLRHKIAERLTRDLHASVEQRIGGIDTAMDMYRNGNSLLGVGLNNYWEYEFRYGSNPGWIPEYIRYGTNVLHVRFIAAPENGFLFVLAELGALGFLGFGIYMLGICRAAVRAIRGTQGVVCAICLAMFVGMVGVWMQQSVDYSYWVDPVLYTFTFMVAMLNAAPSLWPRQTSPVVQIRRREEIAVEREV